MSALASSASSAKATKKSAFSCEPCRRRKVKCGGEQPICQRCTARNDECIYKLNPTLSYTQRLENRIKELEDQLSSNESTVPSPSSSNPPSTHQESSPIQAATPNFIRFVGASSAPQHVDNENAVHSFRGLMLDDRGGITYHGAMSFFNLPNDLPTAMETTVGPAITAPHSSTRGHGRRERLVSNAWQQRALENMSQIPEPFQHLLNIHWCWIQPLFQFVYRPAFTRDMQTLGPYYSHTLMNALLSHSNRWVRNDPEIRQILDKSYDGGAIFGKHAREMLFDELSKGICTIPTVQTLLLLSAQECSLGNATQAWTYSGLAFRLIDHLGICLDGDRYPASVHLSDEDLEIRRRVFWSSYFWDKILSVYLGRAPSMQLSTVSPPQMIFDDSNEEEIWLPFSSTQETSKYPPSTAHSTSCFLSMCRLSVIFNEILIHMYDPLTQNTKEEIQECLKCQEPTMNQWWDELEPFLKIDANNLPAVAPPSHIVTTNCLYHTFRILLFRPMLCQVKVDEAGPSHMHCYIQCVNSATSIIAIFDLFCRTFDFGSDHCVLSHVYSLYIASTIFLLQIQACPGDQQAMRKLSFGIQVLEQVKVFSPVIGPALDLIMQELLALGISINTASKPWQEPSAPTSNMEILHESSSHSENANMSIHGPSQAQSLMQNPDQENMTADMTSGIFQAMSSFEPLSASVGALHESSQGPLEESNDRR